MDSLGLPCVVAADIRMRLEQSGAIRHGLRHYSSSADLRQKMRGVVASFEAELNKRHTQVAKPAT